jgi:hypothetical protein
MLCTDNSPPPWKINEIKKDADTSSPHPEHSIIPVSNVPMKPADEASVR